LSDDPPNVGSPFLSDQAEVGHRNHGRVPIAFAIYCGSSFRSPVWNHYLFPSGLHAADSWSAATVRYDM
jgi:hypothetical protein